MKSPVSFVGYLHGNGRIGVIVGLRQMSLDDVYTLGRDLAMQVASMNPDLLPNLT